MIPRSFSASISGASTTQEHDAQKTNFDSQTPVMTIMMMILTNDYENDFDDDSNSVTSSRSDIRSNKGINSNSTKSMSANPNQIEEDDKREARTSGNANEKVETLNKKQNYWSQSLFRKLRPLSLNPLSEQGQLLSHLNMRKLEKNQQRLWKQKTLVQIQLLSKEAERIPIRR